MALPKPIIASLDEIPEDATISLREAYVQATQDEADEFNDGKPFLKFGLDHVGGWGNANVSRLTAALETTRVSERTLERFGKITPEQAKAALAAVDGLREDLANAKKGGKAAEEWEKQRDELVTAHATAVGAKDEEIGKLRGDLDSRVLRADAIEALIAAGFKDHADLMVDQMLGFMRYVPADNGAPGRTEIHRNGTARLNASAQPMVPKELAAEFAGDARFKVLLDADGASGGDSTGGGTDSSQVRPSKDKNAPVPIKSGAQIGRNDLRGIAAHGVMED